jgi:hypothetical protein
MEKEVTMKMYYPATMCNEGAHINLFRDWFMMMHERLEEFNNRVSSGQVNNIDLQLFRLNRPSPRIPNPTREMRKKALQSAIALIKEYENMGRSGKLFYIWYAAHYLVELGAVLLHSIISGLENMTKEHDHLVDFDTEMLSKTVRTFSQLLGKLASHWPAIQPQASKLEEIAILVYPCLEQDSEQFDFSIAKQNLSSFFMFSHAQSNEQVHCAAVSTSLAPPSDAQCLLPIVPAQVPSLFNATSSAHDAFVIMNQISQPSLSIRGLASLNQLAEPIITQLPSPSWVLPQHCSYEPMLFMDQYYTLYPDPRTTNTGGFSGEEYMSWHLAGLDSDQIFTALLEGGAGGTLTN